MYLNQENTSWSRLVDLFNVLCKFCCLVMRSIPGHRYNGNVKADALNWNKYNDEDELLLSAYVRLVQQNASCSTLFTYVPIQNDTQSTATNTSSKIQNDPCAIK